MLYNLKGEVPEGARRPIGRGGRQAAGARRSTFVCHFETVAVRSRPGHVRRLRIPSRAARHRPVRLSVPPSAGSGCPLAPTRSHPEHVRALSHWSDAAATRPSGFRGRCTCLPPTRLRSALHASPRRCNAPRARASPPPRIPSNSPTRTHRLPPFYRTCDSAACTPSAACPVSLRFWRRSVSPLAHPAVATSVATTSPALRLRLTPFPAFDTSTSRVVARS